VTAPGLLICSGLDPSGGAGLIADVRIAALLDTRPAGVVTALTIQNTTGVIASVPLDPELIRQQLEMLLSDVEVAAVKIGMIGSPEIATAIGHALQLTRAPVIWDPVARASRGETALIEGALADERSGFAGERSGIDLAIAALGPHLALVTPNVAELAMITGLSVEDVDDAVEAGLSVAARLDTAVLVKGGHLGGADASDYLCRTPAPGRQAVIALPGERIAGGEHVHGTGCALSTAIAAFLANGADLVEACGEAKRFVAELIGAPATPGRGAPAVV
jgi:hydroxymethylpyrimidine kinase/phosphomethylpyrimidine kinase